MEFPPPKPHDPLAEATVDSWKDVDKPQFVPEIAEEGIAGAVTPTLDPKPAESTEKSVDSATVPGIDAPKRRGPLHRSRFILELCAAAAEEGTEVQLSPLEQKTLRILQSDHSLSGKQIAHRARVTARSISRAKDRIIRKLSDALPHDRKIAELERIEKEKQQIMHPSYEFRPNAHPGIDDIWTMGALFLERGIDPLSFLTPAQQEAYTITTENPRLSLKQIAELLFVSVPAVRKTYRSMLISLAQHLPEDIAVPDSIGLKTVSQSEGNIDPNQTASSSETIYPKDEITQEAIALLEESDHVPAKWKGHHIVRLEKAVAQMQIHVSYSRTERKLLEILRTDSFASNARLAKFAGIEPASIPNLMSRLSTKLRSNLPKEQQREEIDYIKEILARPTYDIAPGKSAVNGLRTIKKILVEHNIKPQLFLTEHHRDVFEVIVLNPDLSTQRIADILQKDPGSFKRLCSRIIRQLSFLIPPEAEIPPILRRTSADHYLAGKVGRELLRIILEESIADIASKLYIGETALKNFLTGQEVSSPDKILDPLLQLFELPPEEAAYLRQRYIASMGESDNDQKR